MTFDDKRAGYSLSQNQRSGHGWPDLDPFRFPRQNRSQIITGLEVAGH